MLTLARIGYICEFRPYPIKAWVIGSGNTWIPDTPAHIKPLPFLVFSSSVAPAFSPSLSARVLLDKSIRNNSYLYSIADLCLSHCLCEEVKRERKCLFECWIRMPRCLTSPRLCTWPSMPLKVSKTCSNRTSVPKAPSKCTSNLYLCVLVITFLKFKQLLGIKKGRGREKYKFE